MGVPQQSDHVSASLFKAFENLYSSEDNPYGVINLGVAENSLMSDWMIRHLNEQFRLEAHHLHYESVTASNPFKRSLCWFLNKYFNPLIPISEDHLICGVGVTAVLEHLFYGICDKGDHALISQPYYPGFDKILEQRFGLIPIGFDILEPTNPVLVLEGLEKSFQDHSHLPIKAVILCNPHNPLGYCASREVLLVYLHFCEKHNLQLVVDEIYALSVFDSGPNFNRFISILSIDIGLERKFNWSRVHVVYGLSKDFGLCGLRVGVLISQHNPNLIQNLRLAANRIQIPTAVEVLASGILSNPTKLDWYINENKKRILDSYRFVTQELTSIGVNFIPCNAGIFLMIDLSKYLILSEQNQSQIVGEEFCFLKLLNDFRIYIGAGMIFYHHPKPGFFRLTFAVPRDYLNIGLKNLKDFVSWGEAKIIKTFEFEKSAQVLKF